MTSESIHVRLARPDDLSEVGRILYTAFCGIADRHNFRHDFPSQELATQFAAGFIADPGTYGVVAEIDGRVVGSNFLLEVDPIRSVGPITVDPNAQSKGVGRRLMQAVIDRARDAVGVRLVQDSFNTASLSLYASLGFDVREPLALVEGWLEAPLSDRVVVRPLEPRDFDACAALSAHVTGFERVNELKTLPPLATPYVAVQGDYVVAYATSPGFWPLNHAVARAEEDMRDLLAGIAAASGESLSFLFATRQADLFRWALASGLRVVKPMTLMSRGAYREPTGIYLPSVGY